MPRVQRCGCPLGKCAPHLHCTPITTQVLAAAADNLSRGLTSPSAQEATRRVHAPDGGRSRCSSSCAPPFELDSCVEMCGPVSVLGVALRVRVLVNYSEPHRVHGGRTLQGSARRFPAPDQLCPHFGPLPKQSAMTPTPSRTCHAGNMWHGAGALWGSVT